MQDPGDGVEPPENSSLFAYDTWYDGRAMYPIASVWLLLLNLDTVRTVGRVSHGV